MQILLVKVILNVLPYIVTDDLKKSLCYFK